MPKGSVKIMLSYDYNHFEVCLSSDEEMSLEQIDNMRKDVQRLTNKAVKQYKIAKDALVRKGNYLGEKSDLEKEIKIIKENYPKSEWTEEQKAKIKRYDDLTFWESREYDYEDDWDE